MSSTIQRKRRNATPSSSRSNAKTSRTGSVPAAAAPDQSETMDVAESSRASSEEDVVDLTCEGSEPAAVVDLTNNDSVVLRFFPSPQAPTAGVRSTARATCSVATRRRRTPTRPSTRPCSPPFRLAAEPGLPLELSAAQYVWTLMERSLRVGDWWSPLSVVTSSVASASVIH
ncbi:RING finger protein 4 isoform X3 [Osmerus eperlanus]|uniref:RING finger protein 4 isoform X3 n=1 Tax=Osmerus eperlanus TaxID=29151 RepID=UPI002E123C75